MRLSALRGSRSITTMFAEKMWFRLLNGDRVPNKPTAKETSATSRPSGEITGKGFVTVIIKGESKGEIEVVREDGEWRMDEN